MLRLKKLIPGADYMSEVPEIQGTAAEVSREKCRQAAEIVSGTI